MNLKEILKNKVFTSDISDLDLKNRCIINTINPHSYILTKNDAIFKNALMNGDVLLPDGSGIVLAHKVLIGGQIEKIAGSDIHQYLLNKADIDNQKVFYLGASEKTLELIKKRLQHEFPNLKVASYSPEYKASFNDEDTNAMIKAVNDFNPNFLFVGMTAPKQEKWVYQNKDRLNSKVIASVGAVFDFYAGTIKRPNKIWIKLGLEWFPRFLKEPKRLWKRNFVSTPLFLWEICKVKINGN
jgi:N-acetylglucosaminyldiphosphoundecaprenol N-acetyl-beta-D-mannosaminyltransferase